jgi:Flp pilus assembly protein TadD
MSAKYRPTRLRLLALLPALALSGVALGQQTAMDFFHRGGADMGKRDWGRAVADFSKAIDLDPKDADAYLHRGNVKKTKGDQAGADADFAQAAKFKDSRP